MEIQFGKKIGKLTVIEPVNDNDGRSKWLCLCDCGNTKIILRDKLSGKSPTLQRYFQGDE